MFWIPFKDFVHFFYAVTINYTRPEFNHIKLSEIMKDEQWSAARIKIPKTVEENNVGFFTLFQLNLKFFDQSESEE